MMAVFLQKCVDQMEKSRHWFESSVLPLSLDQLRWHPQTGCWSIGECLEHLNLTLAHYLPRIEASLTAGAAPNGDALLLPFPEAEREYLSVQEPPVSERTLAPAALRPTAAVDPDRIVDEFIELRERFAKVAWMMSGPGLAGCRISGSLHLPVESAGGVLALLAAHDRRHIWQAERVRGSARFPV